MTDLLDRPIGPAAGVPELDQLDDGVVAGEEAERPGSGARGMLAALSAAAAVIHLVMVPSHLGESTVEGVLFLVAAWVQVGLAVALFTRATRRVLAITIAANLVFIGSWLVSRTVGLPYGSHPAHPETVSFVDGACVALEAALVVLAAVLLVRPTAALTRSGSLRLGIPLAAFVVATAAIASPGARNHAAHSHGEGESEAVATDGHDHGTAATDDDLGFSALANGQMGSHEHPGQDGAPAAEEIDPATAGELAGQLALTAPLAAQYPTIQDAVDAGYSRAGPFAPGLGIHYSPPTYGGFLAEGDGMSPEQIANPMLIFAGTEPDAPLAGFMYLRYQETAPEGFAGPLDTWHYHETVCIVTTPDGIDTPFGADLTGVTDQMCTDAGGTMLDFTGYMVHVWTVPGWESTDGTFSDLNRAITCPDGTYYTVPIAEVGGRNSICKNA